MKLLVLGADADDDVLSKAEEGTAGEAPEPTASPPSHTESQSSLSYYGGLLLCIAGLQGSYLTWGVLQVRSMGMGLMGYGVGYGNGVDGIWKLDRWSMGMG